MAPDKMSRRLNAVAPKISLKPQNSLENNLLSKRSGFTFSQKTPNGMIRLIVKKYC